MTTANIALYKNYKIKKLFHQYGYEKKCYPIIPRIRILLSANGDSCKLYGKNKITLFLRFFFEIFSIVLFITI